MPFRKTNIVGQRTEHLHDVDDLSYAEIQYETIKQRMLPDLDSQERGEVSAIVREIIPNLDPNYADNGRYEIRCQPLGTHEGVSSLIEMCVAKPAPHLSSEAVPPVGSEIRIRFDNIKNKNYATYMGPAGGLGAINTKEGTNGFLESIFGKNKGLPPYPDFVPVNKRQVSYLNITEQQMATKKPVTAYRGGKEVGVISVIILEGKEVEINTAEMYLRMKKAAAKDGINLSINSAFRTNEAQEYFYKKYLAGTGNKAAAPGHSNHQNGIALDISNAPQKVAWLTKNAESFGFYRTVASENWHWEFRGDVS